MSEHSTFPLVLAIGGHDPSGGAGIQADIETVTANRCRALSVVTALTSQNTCGVRAILPQPPSRVAEQCRLVLEESTVAAIKIGLIGNAGIAAAIAETLAQHPKIPVVLDPVLASGSGTDMADAAVRGAITDVLAPYATLLTPNSREARLLTGREELADCALTLVRKRCAAVLITGGHEDDSEVINRLYGLGGLMQEESWPRLEGEFHGSGCTLASAVACGLGKGLALVDAVAKAQDFTWNALRCALATGRCQLTPNRFWEWD